MTTVKLLNGKNFFTKHPKFTAELAEIFLSRVGSGVLQQCVSAYIPKGPLGGGGGGGAFSPAFPYNVLNIRKMASPSSWGWLWCGE